MVLLPYFSVLFSLSIFVIAECSREFPSAPTPLSLQHSSNSAPTPLSLQHSSNSAPTPLSLQHSSNSAPTPLSLQHSSNWKRITVLTITTATITIASLIVIIILLCKRYSRENLEQCEQQSANVNILIAKDSVRYFQEGHTMFKFDDLLSVESEMISDKRETAKGSSYKVVLKNGRAFVIKWLNPVVPQKSESAQFEAHINEVAGITGRHIVNIRAFFFNEQERLLVYDYMPMGSLDALLHQNVEYRLQWKICWIIALGVAKGIKRIHKKSGLHGNVRSTNILFGPSYDIRVSENGLFDLVAYKDDSAACENPDIYSFGLVLLELLSRKKPTQWDRHLLQFAVDNYESEIEGQPEMSEYLNHYIDKDLVQEEGVRLNIVLLIRLALECAVENNGNVSMSEVVRQIEWIGVHGYRSNSHRSTSSTIEDNAEHLNLDRAGPSKSRRFDSDEDRVESFHSFSPGGDVITNATSKVSVSDSPSHSPCPSLKPKGDAMFEGEDYKLEEKDYTNMTMMASHPSGSSLETRSEEDTRVQSISVGNNVVSVSLSVEDNVHVSMSPSVEENVSASLSVEDIVSTSLSVEDYVRVSLSVSHEENVSLSLSVENNVSVSLGVEDYVRVSLSVSHEENVSLSLSVEDIVSVSLSFC